jgi:hypothetical protein
MVYKRMSLFAAFNKTKLGPVVSLSGTMTQAVKDERQTFKNELGSKNLLTKSVTILRCPYTTTLMMHTFLIVSRFCDVRTQKR